MQEERYNDAIKESQTKSRITSFCSQIEDVLVEMMLDNGEDELSPSQYLDTHFDEIYQKITVDDEEENDEDFKDMIYNASFIHVDFESIQDSLDEGAAYAKDPYAYNGVSKRDFY